MLRTRLPIDNSFYYVFDILNTVLSDLIAASKTFEIVRKGRPGLMPRRGPWPWRTILNIFFGLSKAKARVGPLQAEAAGVEGLDEMHAERVKQMAKEAEDHAVGSVC